MSRDTCARCPATSQWWARQGSNLRPLGCKASRRHLMEPLPATTVTRVLRDARRAHQAGRSTWVRLQSVQRARRGVSRTRPPSSNATTRGRAWDHGASRPVAQDGHASRRAARSASARSGSRYSSTPAQLSGHARHAGRGRPAGEGGVRVAPWPRSDRLTSRRAISARVRQPAQPPRPATTPWPAARSSVVTLSSHTIRPTRLSPTTTREHRR